MSFLSFHITKSLAFYEPIFKKLFFVSNNRRDYGIESIPDIDVAFYYDTGSMALKAVSNQKDAGNWPSLQYTKCNEYQSNDPVIRNNADMKSALKSVSTTSLEVAVVILGCFCLPFKKSNAIKTEWVIGNSSSNNQ